MTSKGQAAAESERMSYNDHNRRSSHLQECGRPNYAQATKVSCKNRSSAPNPDQ